MKKIRLTKEEKEIEKALVAGKYVDVHQNEFEEIAEAIKRRQKTAVLSLRVNQEDIDNIKQKAKKFGIPYQTFISEFIHRLAV